MRKTRKEYTDANRIAWDEAAPRHATHNNEALFAAVVDPGYVSFKGDILHALRQVGVAGKHIIQLGCNNGCETLSLRNLGATRCVGVDASAEFLAHGRELIRLAGAEDQVELVESDVYELPAEFNGAFDMVLVTIGVLSWMPDLKVFFEVVRGLLKPGGQLVMEEMHPVLFMYEENAETGVSSVQYSYFGKHIWEETDGLDYYGHEVYDGLPNYSFMYRLDEILMAGIDAGLGLQRFTELDYDISNLCSDLEQSPTRPPLGFVMVMSCE
ncbi:MAG: class I SAM-dependent methyltransferase [Gammaproteobacteria bacterium]|nr:class I SAM-dependent methyltransferase [Gammaproteobacteria bacterium]